MTFDEFYYRIKTQYELLKADSTEYRAENAKYALIVALRVHSVTPFMDVESSVQTV